ncbi:MAG TPA: TetR/AcrR family transcriptional regulator [Syntrophomonadaceae bacterium]|nr:TetR/AcrR family transcriptional regulator [Syntrophomonadaceae bacterium]
MDKKRQFVLETAAKFFSKNGFFATSVQDIAKECNISKATIYQLFDSKEDILYQIIQYKHDQIIQEAALIDYSDISSPKEQLIEKIVIELVGFHQNNDSVSILFHSDQSIQNNQIKNLFDETQRIMMYWHKESLSKAYGPKVDFYIWDLTLTFQGIIKEFFAFLESKDQINPDYRKIASSIVYSMDAIIEHGNHSQSVLPEEIILELDNNVQLKRNQPMVEWEETISNLKKKIKEDIPEPDKHDLFATVALLEEEKRKDEPRTFLLQALFAYLERHVELIDAVTHLNQLLSKQLTQWEVLQDG